MHIPMLLRRTLEYKLLEEVRYPLEFLMSLLSGTIFVGTILLGIGQAGAPNLEELALALILSLIATEPIHISLAFLEAHSGTAEEAYLAPVPLAVQLGVESLAATLKSLLFHGLIYLLLALAFGLPGRGVELVLLYSVPLFFAAMGIGLLLSGLQLLFKRVQSIAGLLAMGLVGSAFTPPEIVEVVDKWIPFAMGLKGVQGGHVEWVPFIGASAVYFAAGVVLFHWLKALTIRYGLASAR